MRGRNNAETDGAGTILSGTTRGLMRRSLTPPTRVRATHPPAAIIRVCPHDNQAADSLHYSSFRPCRRSASDETTTVATGSLKTQRLPISLAYLADHGKTRSRFLDSRSPARGYAKR